MTVVEKIDYLLKRLDLTEKSFGFDSFNENLLGNTMSISIRYSEDERNDILDFSEFKNKSFSMKVLG